MAYDMLHRIPKYIRVSTTNIFSSFESQGCSLLVLLRLNNERDDLGGNE